ncbi:succinate-semialdehyde dehydrogenase [Bacterioplanes sanyensis]|uniref:Succinate-semialdehyde dehydrogenase n=1 Tax=Bacterioplanes sanyensis TaxID=1249553 RepID=A0A222FL84_9GAMM|nr:NAD-dependent succinate-semialdehyde dehydrogenase [Bacterioplanes sanyensis]ASP39540.1 succinate-semialdehyde dehydrogenase [Bacterioplanes sanyensis]
MLTVISPTTGQPLHQFAALTGQELNDRIACSKEAYASWRRTSFNERAQVLTAVAAELRADQKKYALLMTDEMGKPINEALAEVEKAAWCAEHYAEHAEQYLRLQPLPSDASRSYVQHLPLGPVLGILPWNAPFWLALRFSAPALMAGNTCLMKPDPHVPGCGEALQEVFYKAGAPANIFLNLPLNTEDVASAIRHPDVVAVSFTGSSTAGATVAAIAASEIKPFVLELGGSDPAIVLNDANLDDAIPTIALSRIINAGQSCIAAKRIIAEADVYDAVVERLQTELEQLTLGDPREPSNRIGPIARSDLRDHLTQQVDRSIAAGARCLLGGEPLPRDGFFYPVTLLTDVSNDMPVCQEETFGPVAVVLKADNAEHALALANDSQYGLAAAIWTTAERGEAMAHQLETGQVAINGIVKTDPRLPSGGIKRSGIGRELGPHGILEFVNTQQVWVGPKIV